MIDIQTLKQQHDITNVISRTVDLKTRGKCYVGLCPFHNDTVASLTVYPRQQTYHCFGCGAHGDVISWIEQSLHVDFKTAIRILGNLPEITPEPLFKKKPKKFKSISKKAAEYWHSRLGKRRTYYHNRGFANNTIDRELFGWTGRRYVIPVWTGTPQESTLAAVKLRRDDEGETRRLQENGLDGEILRSALNLIPRYILRGSYEPLLYNRWAIENQAEVWVFFGEFDAALAYQLGLNACSPVHGAGSWQKQWGDDYLRYAKAIVIVPDKNEREQGFIARSLIGGHAGVFKWPDGNFNDFNDYILQGGSVGSFLQMAQKQDLTNPPVYAII
ncbi:MAG: hypothetical protein H8D67_30885 [Deltaproteobacteria bacterium]|nr:hypothetical protein [Deltaproteobacteria bacterium]